MKIEWIEQLLDQVPGVTRDGGAWIVPEDCEAALYVSFPSEVLTVGRVARYSRDGELVVVDTHAGDRYHLPIASITMLRTLAPSKRAAPRGAGFR